MQWSWLADGWRPLKESNFSHNKSHRGEPVPRSWLRTYAEALRQYHLHPETKFRGGDPVQSGPLQRRHIFATAVEYIGKEADRWEEDSHFGADENSAIAYGIAPTDRSGMMEAIVLAIRVEKVGVKKLAKQAGVADRAVTAAVNGGDEVSDEELVKLYRAAENLLAAKRAENEQVAEVLEWAREQKASRLAVELGYDVSNFSKVLAGKIKPKRLIERMFGLREQYRTSER
jgi:hypothetical protein